MTSISDDTGPEAPMLSLRGTDVQDLVPPTFGYIYCIENAVNGKTYVGQRRLHKKLPPDKDGYMGSGNLIMAAIAKYGASNFIKFVLELCPNKKHLCEMERHHIASYRSNGKAEYNIAPGGEGGNLYSLLSAEDKKKYGEKSTATNLKRWKHADKAEHGEKVRRALASRPKEAKEASSKELSEWHKGVKVSDPLYFSNRKRAGAPTWEKKSAEERSQLVAKQVEGVLRAYEHSKNFRGYLVSPDGQKFVTRRDAANAQGVRLGAIKRLLKDKDSGWHWDESACVRKYTAESMRPAYNFKAGGE